MFLFQYEFSAVWFTFKLDFMIYSQSKAKTERLKLLSRLFG